MSRVKGARRFRSNTIAAPYSYAGMLGAPAGATSCHAQVLGSGAFRPGRAQGGFLGGAPLVLSGIPRGRLGDAGTVPPSSVQWATGTTGQSGFVPNEQQQRQQGNQWASVLSAGIDLLGQAITKIPGPTAQAPGANVPSVNRPRVAQTGAPSGVQGGTAKKSGWVLPVVLGGLALAAVGGGVYFTRSR